MIDKAHLDWHFLAIPYAEKLALIRQTYEILAQQPQFDRLPAQWQNIFRKSREAATPLSVEEIREVIARLDDLRNIPDFYLRNFSIGILQDAIRLQFNCDGTHIVSAGDYQEFIERNLDV